MSPSAHDDQKWMRQALALAERGLGATSPNPPVGAVLVRDGILIGAGWHRRAGEPHAEIEAIAAAGGPAAVKGATIYITLEPCSTHGRTPPCVAALITAGIQRVVWAMDDPNPAHAGRAKNLLTQQNIAVEHGVCEPEAQELLTYWTHFIRTGRPWVMAKAGLSLDGKITRPMGEGQWITSEAARADAMNLRRRVDAILVGAETVRQDDPLLTLRPESADRPMPWRIVLSRSGQLPATARIFTDEHAKRTLVLCEPSWDQLWADLAQRGITSVLVEGGADILTQVLSRRLAHEAYFYQAPLMSGGGRDLIATASWAGPSLEWEKKEISLIGDNVRWHLRHPLSTVTPK